MAEKMWSKDAERAQVDKIEALIEETDNGSYIRMAFAGCAEMARENIEFDIGNSFPDLLDTKTKEVAELKRIIAENEREFAKRDTEHGKVLKSVEYDRDTTRQYAEQLESRIADLEHLLESHKQVAKNMSEQMKELQDGIADLQEKVEKRDMEILRLKAEIYDWERS